MNSSFVTTTDHQRIVPKGIDPYDVMFITGYQWHLQKLGIAQAWYKYHVSGKQRHLAIVDTGIDLAHYDLSGVNMTLLDIKQVLAQL
jgi:hypothetical protein